MGKNVKVYHLPNYAKFDLQHNPDGTRVYNPLSLSRLCANLAVANTDPKDVQRYVIIFYIINILLCNYLVSLFNYCELKRLKGLNTFQLAKFILLLMFNLLFRFIGQNRPQFRTIEPEDPDQVKELVQKLEKHQTPETDDSEYVRLELAK